MNQLNIIGHYEETFLSSNQKDQLRVYWYVPEQPKALIQIVHGMIDHLGRYESFGKWCLENDILMVGFDLLGHGQSVRSPLYLGSFGSENGLDFVLQDITNFYFYLQDKYPDLPHFILGHSMGSMLTRKLLSTMDTSGLSGVIFSGTNQTNPHLLALAKGLAWAEKKRKGPWAHSRILEKLTLGNFNHYFEPVKTHLDWLSRDEDYVGWVAVDPLSNFHFTTAGFWDLFTLMKDINQPSIIESYPKEVPIMLISGTKDYVAEDGAIQVVDLAEKYKEQGLNVTLKLYEQGRHELLNETNRLEVFSDLKQWTESLC